MKLSVVVLPELYVGTVILIKGGSAAPTAGRFVQGAPRKPSTAEATISAELWDKILLDSATFKLSIELKYNPNAGTFNEIFIEYV